LLEQWYIIECITDQFGLEQAALDMQRLDWKLNHFCLSGPRWTQSYWLFAALDYFVIKSYFLHSIAGAIES
jgi:hypothetical protein